MMLCFKRKIHIFPLLFVCLFLAACSKSEPVYDQLGNDQIDVAVASGNAQGNLIQGVTVNACTPNLDKVDAYEIVSAHVVFLDNLILQDMKDFIFSSVSEADVFQEDTGDPNRALWSTSKGANGPWMGYYDYPEYKSITLVDGDALMSGGEYVRYEPSIPLESQALSIFTSNELEFMDKQQAIVQVEKQLATWNIRPIGDPKVFCLDTHTLINQLDLEDVKIETDNTLDCYLMVFNIGYNGIPYSDLEFVSAVTGDLAYSTRLNVLFTQKGIIHFECQQIDYKIDEVISKSSEIITLQKAFEILAQEFSEIIITTPIEISEIALQYIPTTDGEHFGIIQENGKTILVPAWVFKPSIDSYDGEVYLDPIVLNAITGQKIT